MKAQSTLTARTIEALRDALVSGHFEQGVNIRESDVCDLCDVSRTPARHALIALHREGLLDYEPQRGYWVRNFDVRVVQHAYSIRGVIEGLVCRLIIERGFDDNLIPELTSEIEKGRRLIAAGRSGAFDGDGWRQMNETFHQAIMLRGPELFMDVAAYVQRIPLAATSVTADLRAEPDLFLIQLAQTDHEKICRAFEQRQGARAEDLMREHLINAGEVLTRSLDRSRHVASPSEGEAGKDSRRLRVRRNAKFALSTAKIRRTTRS